MLFPPEDAQEMISVVQYLLAHPDVAQRLRSAARAKVVYRTWDAVMDKLLDDYAEVIVTRRTNPMRVPAMQPSSISYR